MTGPTITEGLEPCPFDDASGKHKVRVDRQQGRAGVASPSRWFRERVICKCGVSGPEFKRPGEAIAAWNRRVPPPPPEGERDAEREIAEAATKGPWTWWTSNSWRRLKRDDRGISQNVAEPFVARDGHPDLDIKQEDMAFIATFNPVRVLSLLDEVSALSGANERMGRLGRAIERERDEALATVEQLRDRASAAEARVGELAETVARIERWFGEFPETGKFWDDGTPMSYGACYGSNGERDFMRALARTALSSSGLGSLQSASPPCAPVEVQAPSAADVETVRDWLRDIASLDLEDVVADGGITAGMVVQQQAREMARRLDRALAASPTGPARDVEAGSETVEGIEP
jgi:hypothetical protein